MDAAHLHLLLNHIPVVGTLVGLLLLAYGLLRKSDELKRASLAMFVATALLAIPTYFTGESAENLVEHLSGVSATLIERHEDAAFVSVLALELLGLVAISALALVHRSARFANALAVTALVLSIVTGGLMARTANLGGQIRHTEIRPQATAVIGAAQVQSTYARDND